MACDPRLEKGLSSRARERVRAGVPLLLLLFSPLHFVAISLQIIVAAAPAEEGREGGKIRASDKHRAKRSSASCSKKEYSSRRRRWRKKTWAISGSAKMRIRRFGANKTDEGCGSGWLNRTGLTLHALRSPRG